MAEAEFSELKLQVSFVDNASAQLKALVGEVSKMNDLASGSARGFREMSAEAEKFGGELRKIGGLIGEITKLPVGSLLGAGGIAGIAYGIKAMNDQLSVFSREMINLQNSSRVAGILPDQFKSIAAQLKEVGFSSEEANSTIINFFRTVDEAGRAGTAQFQKIYREAWNPTAMMQHIQRLRDMISRGEGAKALEEAAQEGQRIFERELTKPGGSRAEATRQQEAYFESVGLPMKAANIRNLGDVVGDPEKWQKRINAALSFNKEYERFQETTADIGAEMKTTLLPAFEDLNSWLATTGASWTKWIPEQLKVELGTIRQLIQLISGDLKGLKGTSGGIQIAPGGIADVSIYGTPGQVQGPPTAFGQPPIDPTNPGGVVAPPGTEMTPEQTERLQRRYRGRTRATGGPVTGGGPYIVGERGPEVFVPGSSGTVVANLGGGLETSEQKEIVEDEIDQRRELTTNLKQINDMLESGDIDLLRAGTGAGAGWGYGRSGPPGAGRGVPSGPSTGPGGGGLPPGTHGAPGVPPSGPYTPAGTSPATLPGSTASLGYPTGGGFTPVSDLTTASGQPTGAGGAAGTVDRSGLSSQLDDATVQRLMGLTEAEVGGNRDPQARIRFLAGHMNRTLIETGDVNRQMVNGYYPSVTTNQLNKKYTPEQIAAYRRNVLDPVMAGAGGTHTHNASNAPGNPVAANAERKYGPGSGQWVGSEYFYTKTGEQGKLQKYVRREDAPDVKSALTTLRTRATEPGQQAAVPPSLLDPTRMAPLPPVTAGAGGVIDYSKMSGRRSTEGGMEEYIEYAARKSGLNVQIAHGIEPGHSRHRPGSPSYDLDLYDPVTKQRLSANNPEHRGKIAQFIEESAAAGATGIGAGYVYMRGHRFHIGGGNPAVWGDGLVRAGAPKWVIDSYERGRARVITEQKRTAELQRMRDEAERSKVAGPGAGGGAPAGPKIEMLRTRPVEPPADKDTTQRDTGGGGIAAGKGRGAGGSATWNDPYPGGRAAGKGRLRPWGSQGAAAAEENEAAERPWWQLDRAAMDRSEGRRIQQHRVRGRGSVDVTIKKSEDAKSTPVKGPFKKIPMPRQRQHENASSGAPEPTAANHDPGLDS